MKEKYKFGFQIWGVVLFLIVMIPNFIWFAIPAPNDVLRATSITPIVDMVASVFQVIMIILLCAIVNKNAIKLCLSKWIFMCLICLALYFISWVLYYFGLVNSIIVLGLTVPPCMVFLLYSIDRKNYVAIVPIIIFTICHLLYGVVNFIL